MKSLSPQQLHVLQHSLGVDQFGRGERYRNHFVTGPGSKDFDVCRSLVDLGMMRDHGRSELAGGDHTFSVTDDGRRAVDEQSPTPPRVSRGRQRYLDFLEADSGMPFIEWLRWRQEAYRRKGMVAP